MLQLGRRHDTAGRSGIVECFAKLSVARLRRKLCLRVSRPVFWQHRRTHCTPWLLQAALDKAMQESVVQGDYDNILRDVKLWVRDLDGALGDLGEAQRAARDRRAELDRQMSSADPEDEEGWRQVGEQVGRFVPRLGRTLVH